MLLPYYSQGAVDARHQNINEITSVKDLNSLCLSIYTVPLDKFLNPEIINIYLKGEKFKQGAEFFESDTFYKEMGTLILEMHKTASEFGFPLKHTVSQTSKIDFALTKTLYDSLEKSSFNVTTFWANLSSVQEFMTMRVFPLLTCWRWATGENKISEKRVRSSPRNYFFTLWITGYLFNNPGSLINRWELLNYMTADSLVQIIERTAFGYRPEFAKAFAEEIKNRISKNAQAPIEKLVRGATKGGSLHFLL